MTTIPKQEEAEEGAEGVGEVEEVEEEVKLAEWGMGAGEAH